MVTGLGRLWPLKGGGYVAGALGARGRKVASTLPVLFPPPEKSDTFTIFGETGVASPDTLSAEGDNAEASPWEGCNGSLRKGAFLAMVN